MFGTFRTFLALLVVALHIGGVPIIGAYAVFGFYVLSGYLMNWIMHRDYGYSRRGFGFFALNRFLKIYPMYWLSVLLSLALVLRVGQAFTSGYEQHMFLPRNLEEVLKHLFIVFPIRGEPILTPPAWALTVELFFYVMIGLGLSRTRLLTWIWFSVSAVYHGYLNATGAIWHDMYYPIQAASLPFSLGSLIYHYREELVGLCERSFGRVLRYFPMALCVLIVVNWWISYEMKVVGIFLYTNLALQACTIIALCEQRSLPLISRELDASLGRYSYPLYLLHFQVGLILVLVARFFGLTISRPHPFLMLISLPYMFLACWLFIKLVDGPVEALRKRIKMGIARAEA